MRTLILTIIASLSFVSSSYALKICYVDTEYILSSIPEYEAANQQIDQMAENWRQEIDARYKEIEKLYKSYQAEQVLLPEQVKLQRQQEIETKEKAAKEFQKQKFGYEGELFQKKQELIKPIQDKVFKAIEKMARAESWDFVLDRSSGVMMLFANARLDKSDDIIRAMGYTPKGETSNE